MNIKLLTEHHLEFLSLKMGSKGLTESTLVKMPHCWKSHIASHYYNTYNFFLLISVDHYYKTLTIPTSFSPSQRPNNGHNLPLNSDGVVSQHNHMCTTCGKRFYSNTNLNRHMLIHTGDKPYECDVCGRRFNQKSSMVSHKLVHMSSL